ncbi:hypothetical protein PUNSTDRAFT_54636 [Punctularia strigosozonata HHB-11173 SS5]|uniref:uncharacterized protein n=1 Tax=Punctularia strigosozonata (strain HHB-11173) TaxID=741275 RepID=UPI00044171F3|nr:uncharacterized protein PUNSTDRAFT_54636 [Punctularia strigosozonata HHB-11173 SS5]EIN05739.1 hypothetical protein PUNSTDRAFT_54636 [Punctularia strigosozonata HHB-11173 SS5]
MSSNLEQFETQPPTHRVHSQSQPLPGATGAPNAESTIDYSAENVEHARGLGTENDSLNRPSKTQEAKEKVVDMAPGLGSGRGQGAFGDKREDAEHEDRPTDMRSANEGTTVGEQDGPEGHAKFSDKMVGKTQKVMGKVTRNADLHEKGQLREAGGKAATQEA